MWSKAAFVSPNYLVIDAEYCLVSKAAPVSSRCCGADADAESWAVW